MWVTRLSNDESSYTMWLNLLLAVLTVFMILMIHVNMNAIMSHRNKEKVPSAGMMLFLSSIIGITLMIAGLYFTGYLFLF